MGQLIELVFEAATPETAHGLLRDLVDASEGVRDVQVDGASVATDMSVGELIFSTRACATVRLVGFDLPMVGVVADVALRLLKTRDDRFDVEFNFDADDVSELAMLAPGLHSLARRLGRLHPVPGYFAGLEPAADEDTRLFTGESLGPLRFPKT